MSCTSRLFDNNAVRYSTADHHISVPKNRDNVTINLNDMIKIVCSKDGINISNENDSININEIFEMKKKLIEIENRLECLPLPGCKFYDEAYSEYNSLSEKQ